MNVVVGDSTRRLGNVSHPKRPCYNYDNSFQSLRYNYVFAFRKLSEDRSHLYGRQIKKGRLVSKLFFELHLIIEFDSFATRTFLNSLAASFRSGWPSDRVTDLCLEFTQRLSTDVFHNHERRPINPNLCFYELGRHSVGTR